MQKTKRHLAFTLSLIGLVVSLILFTSGCSCPQQCYSPAHPTPLFEHKDGELKANPEEFFCENYLSIIADIALCLADAPAELSLIIPAAL